MSHENRKIMKFGKHWLEQRFSTGVPQEFLKYAIPE